MTEVGQTRGFAGSIWLSGRFRRAWIVARASRIEALGSGDPPRRWRQACEPLAGVRLIPGFVDLLCHGFAGVDATTADAEALAHMADALRAAGVTSTLLGLYPQTPRSLARTVAAWRAVRRRKLGRGLVGLHPEGPFVAPEWAGALRGNLGQPTPRRAAAWLAALGDSARAVTVAPELQGAAEFVSQLRVQGATPFLGHTGASRAECAALARDGAVGVTHLYNRMPKDARRGAVAFALSGGARWVSAIPDGVHIPKSRLRTLARIPLLRRRLLFVSDSLSAAGTNRLAFRSGGAHLALDSSAGPGSRVARDHKKGNLAGALDPLSAQLLARVADGTITWAQAIRGGCENPGRFLGNCGSFAVGMRADWLCV